jgi:hypothetical protein
MSWVCCRTRLVRQRGSNWILLPTSSICCKPPASWVLGLYASLLYMTTQKTISTVLMWPYYPHSIQQRDTIILLCVTQSRVLNFLSACVGWTWSNAVSRVDYKKLPITRIFHTGQTHYSVGLSIECRELYKSLRIVIVKSKEVRMDWICSANECPTRIFIGNLLGRLSLGSHVL